MKAFPCCTTPFVDSSGNVRGDILADPALTNGAIEEDPQMALLNVLMHLSVSVSDGTVGGDKYPPIVDALA